MRCNENMTQLNVRAWFVDLLTGQKIKYPDEVYTLDQEYSMGIGTDNVNNLRIKPNFSQPVASTVETKYKQDALKSVKYVHATIAVDLRTGEYRIITRGWPHSNTFSQEFPTFVNNVRIDNPDANESKSESNSAKLKDGDVIRLDKYPLRFECENIIYRTPVKRLPESLKELGYIQAYAEVCERKDNFIVRPVAFFKDGVKPRDVLPPVQYDGADKDDAMATAKKMENLDTWTNPKISIVNVGKVGNYPTFPIVNVGKIDGEGKPK